MLYLDIKIKAYLLSFEVFGLKITL